MPETVSSVLKPPVLIVVNPSGQRSRVVLNRFPFLIGRQTDNHLVLRDNRVSRVHARFDHSRGNYTIEDLKSRHGTFINGKQLDGTATLEHGDQITFGFADGYTLTFQHEERDITRLVDQVAAPGLSTHLAKLKALVEVARALHSSLSMQEVLESIVDAALAVTTSDRGFLFLRRGDKLQLKVARDADNNPLSQDDLQVPAQIIYQALQSRRDLLSMNFDPLAGHETDRSVAALELRSAICIPLVQVGTGEIHQTIVSTAADTIGLIYLDSRVQAADLSSGNQEILQTLALEASTVLENARLLEHDRNRKRMESELQIARHIQQDLLPDKLPNTGWFRAAASSLPSELVGGDYFDVVQLTPDCWSFLVADVSGKGVSSALLAALLQGTFLLAPDEPEAIRSLFVRLNRYLYERTQGEKYATIFYAAVHRNGEMHWCNAGHGSPSLVNDRGELRPMDPTSLPVGMLEEADFEVKTTRLENGDKIVIFSDGLSEAQNPAGQFLEPSQLEQLLVALAGTGSLEFHRGVLEAVAGFTQGAPQRDDVTLLVVEYLPSSLPH
ncbi:MAG: SpoIIE family protein phosphatase [Bryobacteraceae bacterium]